MRALTCERRFLRLPPICWVRPADFELRDGNVGVVGATSAARCLIHLPLECQPVARSDGSLDMKGGAAAARRRDLVDRSGPAFALRVSA
jgi:hypothetical protein